MEYWLSRGEETDTGGNAHSGVKGRIAETVKALLATLFNPSSLHLTDLERKCQQKIITLPVSIGKNDSNDFGNDHPTYLRLGHNSAGQAKRASQGFIQF